MTNQNDNPDDLENDYEDFLLGQQVNEAYARPLFLSPVELLNIDDGLSLLVNKGEFSGAVTLRPVFPSAGIGCSIELIAKVGQAILKMSENLEEPIGQTVSVTDIDIYVLRELVISQILKIDKSIAFGLRLKLYSLLYSDSVKAEELEQSLERLIKASDKDGKLGTVLDGFSAEHEN